MSSRSLGKLNRQMQRIENKADEDDDEEQEELEPSPDFVDQ